MKKDENPEKKGLASQLGQSRRASESPEPFGSPKFETTHYGGSPPQQPGKM